MVVDSYDESQRAKNLEENENDGGEAPEPVIIEGHWKLGAPLKKISARDWEKLEMDNIAFRRFEAKLTIFLAQVLPSTDQALRLSGSNDTSVYT
ncbi:hypothetical protein M422DRAFT_239322 [Sphaerobolus stellatus SS14]|nr:hypothetical protein M422DRAFT_239322 [Sphaerobolus stellatus SS14]